MPTIEQLEGLLGGDGSVDQGLVEENTEVLGVEVSYVPTSSYAASVEAFKTGDVQFMGQAGLAFATVGAAGTPAYNDGVAIATVTRFGLMGEFTISGAKFTYKPVSET